MNYNLNVKKELDILELIKHKKKITQTLIILKKTIVFLLKVKLIKLYQKKKEKMNLLLKIIY